MWWESAEKVHLWAAQDVNSFIQGFSVEGSGFDMEIEFKHDYIILD